MKSIFTLIFLCLTGIALSATQRYRLMFNDDPATTITFGWQQVSGSNGEVYYDVVDHGTDWTQYANSEAVYKTTNYMGMTNCFAKLTDLTPNTVYYFVIKDSEGTSFSESHWFKTCPDVNTETLSFISGGDSRSGQTQRQNSNKMVGRIRPHAVLFGGDLVNTPGNSSVQEWFDDWQMHITSDRQMIPMVHSFGNHEAYGTGGAEFIEQLFDTPYDVYYNVKFGGDLFSFYTLNGELLPGHTIANATKRTQQKNWLHAELMTDNSIWKAAQYHRPIVPHHSSKGEGADEFNDWAHDFYDYGVRMVMESDAHVTKVTQEVKPAMPTASGASSGWFTTAGIDPDKGITFTGEGAWGTIRTPDDGHPFTINMTSMYQFQWIIIDACKVEVRTIDTQSPTTVPEHSPTDLFSISAGLDAQIWKPSGLPSGVIEIVKCSPPNTDFIADNTALFTGGTVNFTDISTNTPTGWTWDFGDLGTSSVQHPSHTYTAPGAYTVELTATNADGFDTETKVAYISVYDPAPPVTDFTVDNTNPNVSQTVNFTDLSSNVPDTWLWNFGDAGSSTAQNPTHVYTTPGTYTVTLTASNVYGGDVEIKTNYIVVNSGGSVSSQPQSGNDDAEENTSGWWVGDVSLTSTDLELGNDGGTEQTVGVRFPNLDVPQGAIITNAYIKFQCDEADAFSSQLNIYFRAENNDDAAPFTTADFNISSRPLTTAQTTWADGTVPGWSVGTYYDSPDVSSIIQEVVNRPGWAAGNAMAVMMWSDPGESSERVSGSFEGGYAAPELIFDWHIPAPPAPTASFSPSTNSICAGESINFTDASSDNPTTWLWDFGDTETSTEQNPTHVYTTSGTYTVSLTATNGSGSNMIVMTDVIAVNGLPSVSAGTNQTICEGDNSSISASGAANYTWDQGLGVGVSHNVSPTVNTIYTVTGTDGNGCENTSSITIDVNPLPSVSAGTNQTICEGDNSSISASGAVTYSWDQGLGVGVSHNVSPTVNTIYTVTGTDGNGCENTSSITIDVDQPGNAGTAAPILACNLDNNVDLGNTITGEDAGGIWSDDDLTGALSGNMLDATGLIIGNTYNFSYEVPANGVCSAQSVQTQVTISGTVSAGTSTGTIDVCTTNNTFDLFSTISGYSGGGTWSDDDATGVLTGNIVNGSGLTPGTYDFTYYVDGGGCGTDSETIQISVTAPPTVTTSGDISICEGESTIVSASGAPQLTWDNGIGAGASHTISPTTTTSYIVTGTDGDCSAQSAITVTVNPLPVISFVGSMEDTLCRTNESISLPTGLPSGGAWSGNGVTGSSFNSSNAGLGTHIATYNYTDSDGCSNSAELSITVMECLGIFDGELNVFNIYPNPASAYIVVERDNPSEYKKIEIYDMKGKIVYSKTVTDNPIEISTSEWERGSYTITFTNDANSVVSRKIVLQ